MLIEHDPNAKPRAVIARGSTQTIRVSSNAMNITRLAFNKKQEPELGEQAIVRLEIPVADAGLLREVLRIAFHEAWRCSDPTIFDGTGALQCAITKLHKSIDQQLGPAEGETR
jgi:hypothetical protein